MAFIPNPYSGRDIFEESLREIVANLNYVRTRNGFQVSSHEGEAINEWTGVSDPVTQVMEGVSIDADNNIYVMQNTQSGDHTTQTAHVLRKFDVEGNSLASVTIAHGAGASQIQSCTDMTIDGDGNVHIYDAVNQQIRVFSATTGAWVRTYGSLGASAGACINYNRATGYIFVARNATDVYKYSVDGTLQATLALASAVFIRGVSFALSGNCVWLSTDAGGTIHITDGNLAGLVTSWSFATASNGNGSCTSASRITVDFANQVYLSTSTAKIVRCNLNGVFQAAFGGVGSGLGLFTTIGHIEITTTGQVIVGDVVEDTLARFRASIIYIDVEWFPLRKYSATNECAVTPANRIVPWGYNADGVLVPTSATMNVPIPRTVLTSGQYQAPLHILVIRDLRQYCDEMAVSKQLINKATLLPLTRDWSTVNDLYYAAIGNSADRKEAVGGSLSYTWQRKLGKIAALRPNPQDFIELKYASEWIRDCAESMY